MSARGARGPLTVHKEAINSLTIRDGRGREVALLTVDDGRDVTKGMRATANLFAAAPELLAACEAAAAHHQGGGSEIGKQLRAAIAKARPAAPVRA